MTIVSSVSTGPAVGRRWAFLAAVLVVGVPAGLGLGTWLAGRLDAAPSRAAVSAGWTDNLQAVGGRMRRAFPAVAGDWSTAITDQGRAYKALRPSPSEPEYGVRAYVDRGDRVSEVRFTDSGDRQRQTADAASFVGAVVPGASANDRRSAADALAAVLAQGQLRSVDVDGVRFQASSGLLHFTLRAAPAAGK